MSFGSPSNFNSFLTNLRTCSIVYFFYFRWDGKGRRAVVLHVDCDLILMCDFSNFSLNGAPSFSVMCICLTFSNYLLCILFVLLLKYISSKLKLRFWNDQFLIIQIFLDYMYLYSINFDAFSSSLKISHSKIENTFKTRLRQ